MKKKEKSKMSLRLTHTNSLSNTHTHTLTRERVCVCVCKREREREDCHMHWLARLEKGLQAGFASRGSLFSIFPFKLRGTSSRTLTTRASCTSETWTHQKNIENSERGREEEEEERVREREKGRGRERGEMQEKISGCPPVPNL